MQFILIYVIHQGDIAPILVYELSLSFGLQWIQNRHFPELNWFALIALELQWIKLDWNLVDIVVYRPNRTRLASYCKSIIEFIV